MKLNLILLFGFLSYIYDINIDNHYGNCKNNLNINFIIFIHHIISFYILFGWINNNNPTIYLLTLIIVNLHWMTNNYKCFLTQSVNDFCGIDSNYYLRDIAYFLGLKKNNKIYYGYLISIIIYLLYKYIYVL
jgi:hypothetical protein